MAHVDSTGGSRQTPSRRRRRAQGRGVLVIGVACLVVFAAGFFLLWSLGSWIVGGGLPGSDKSGGQALAASLPSQSDYDFTPSIDMLAFRDASYVPVKGAYITSYAAGSSKYMTNMLALADQTEINSFVIDVKDATGYVSYDADVPLAKQLGLIDKRIPDIDALIATLRQHNIKPIARIVCFNDPVLAKKMPALAVKSKSTGLNWQDNKKSMYTNPYNRQVWEYLTELGEDAARHGFQEIQFDYVRFPSDGKISDAVYPGADSSKEDAIAGFLGYARARLEKLGVWVSADVFGLTVHVNDDMGIGQKIEKVAANVDIVCPMVYPSHYYKGSYGIALPNSQPYAIVSDAMKDAQKRLPGTGAMVRPWLQDFTLGKPAYGADQVKAQIKAVEDLGINEWILWNAGVKYTKDALSPQ